MYSKGAATRLRIAKQAAPVFNTHGFYGASLDELVRATGIKKGGLYNHFPSKEALALAAFDFALARFRERFVKAVENTPRAADRLHAIVHTMLRSYADPAVAGGCVLLNTAVESDDAALPALRERTQIAMRDLLRFTGAQIKLGMQTGELRADVDPRLCASVIVSTCEGAVMLSKLFGDDAHVRRATEHLQNFVTSLVAHLPAGKVTHG
jgi:TetR/AcrR family transcriptional regulator, transcriptional repressor for nem operon